jgi:iron uptake system component EfeO
MKHPIPLALSTVAATLLLLAGCVPAAPDDDAAPTVIAVESTDDDCAVATDSAQSGRVTFAVSNLGERVTEFYLIGDDELSIVAEVEDIAPGTSRDLTVVVQPGTYYTVCKPGMTGEGVGKAEFTVVN